MNAQNPSFAHLADAALLACVSDLAARERRCTAELIAALAEVDERRLYLGLGCSSLFTYCTQVLHLSEHAAYGRIEAARAARRCPSVLTRLTNGDLTLTAVCLLAPHLTAENEERLLAAARHKSKREIERLIAELRPQPPVPSTIRKLPTPAPGPRTPAPASPRAASAALPWTAAPASTAVSSPAPRPAVIAPLAPERYKLQITMSRKAHDTLRRAQELMRHVVPNGDPAVIVERALTLLVQQLERTKLAQTQRSSHRKQRLRARRSRHIPAAVRREVWQRDGSRCTYVGAAGRCTETGFLELHHVVPFARGGSSDAHNVVLRCRAHNGYAAALDFGRRGQVVRETPPVYQLDSAARSGPSQARSRPSRWRGVSVRSPGSARSDQTCQHRITPDTYGAYGAKSSIVTCGAAFCGL